MGSHARLRNNAQTAETYSNLNRSDITLRHPICTGLKTTNGRREIEAPALSGLAGFSDNLCLCVRVFRSDRRVHPSICLSGCLVCQGVFIFSQSAVTGTVDTLTEMLFDEQLLCVFLGLSVSKLQVILFTLTFGSNMVCLNAKVI